LNEITEPVLTTDVWFKKKNHIYYSFEDSNG